MTPDKRAIIYGMALGDGYVNVRNRYRGNSRYEAREMQIKHSAQQREYLEHKAKRLGWALGGRKINVHPGQAHLNGKTFQQYLICVSHPYFGQVRRVLYPEGKKRYTAQVLSYLNPEALAYWYMDDGHARVHVNKRGFVSSVATDIATECSEEEVDLIIDYFQEEHSVVFKKRLRKGAERYSIQANTEDSHKFCEIIAPYIVPSMLYKLRHVADLKSHERRAPVGNCVSCGAVIYSSTRKGMCGTCYSADYRHRR